MSDERARAFFREVLDVRKHSPYNRCAYCGAHCYGIACRSHWDLLTVDANYNEARAWAS